jgi:hypothetical protein
MLSAEVVVATGGWLWRSDKIDIMLEVVLDWFGRLVDKMMRPGVDAT